MINGKTLGYVFCNKLPVLYIAPGQPPVTEAYIKRIIYAHTVEGELAVMAEILNLNVSGESDKTTTVDAKCLYTLNEIDENAVNEFKAEVNELPPEIWKLFKRRAPITVCDAPRRDYEEISEIEYSVLNGKIEPRCIVYGGIPRRRTVDPYSIKPDPHGHSFYYYSELNSEEVLADKKIKSTNLNHENFVKEQTQTAIIKFREAKERLRKEVLK